MEAFLVSCVLAAVAWFFLSRSRGVDRNRLSPARPKRSAPSSVKTGPAEVAQQLIVGEPSCQLAWNGAYAFPVVGESHYQEALRHIAGAEESEAKRHECEAVLVHQPKNKFDKNACAVTIDGRLVGYLPSDEAKIMVSFMRSKGLAEGFSVGCKAVILGGWVDKDGRKGSYGVYLGIDAGEFPATAIEKEMIRYLGIKAPQGLTRGMASSLRAKAAQVGGSRYVQWEMLAESIEYLHSKDGRDEFDEIKKPSIKAIRDAFEHFLNEGKSPDEIRDDLDDLVEYMIDQNPNLEK